MQNASTESSENVIEHLESIRKGDKNIEHIMDSLNEHRFFTNLDEETVETQKNVRDNIQDLLGDAKIMGEKEIMEHEVDKLLEALLQILEENQEKITKEEEEMEAEAEREAREEVKATEAAEEAEAEKITRRITKKERWEKRNLKEQAEEAEKEKGVWGVAHKTRKRLSEFWHGEGEKLDEKATNLLKDRLKNPKLISHLDPTCAVINDMVKGMNEDDLEELENFLRNPKELADVSEADEAKIDALVKKEKVKDLKNLLKKLQTQLKQAKRRLDSYGGRLNAKAFDTSEEARIDVDKLEIQVENTELLISKRSKNFQYKSTRHILSMIYYHKNKDNDETVQLTEMEEELDEKVHAKRKSLYNGAYKWLDRTGRFLQFEPTLEGNLRALEKDEDFKKLGEKPAEKLAELARLTKNEYNDVKSWVESLDGGIDKHANSTVPRLAAYLELTMRDASTSMIKRTGRTKKLVDNLKQVQREYIEEEVGKVDYDNDQEEALAKIKKLNESNRHTADLSEKILRNNALKSGGLKAVGIAGVAASVGALTMGIVPAMALIAGAPASAAAGTLIGSKHIPEKHRETAKKIAKRTLYCTGALTAGLAIPGALGLLGFGIAGGTILASPKARKWLVEHKGGIAKGAGAVAGTAAKATWLTGKYTIGLPFVIAAGMFKGVRRVTPGL